MKRRVYCCVAVFFVVLMFAVPGMAIEYPGREDPKYQNVPYIEIEELYQDYLDGNVIIVDVRSELEYNTIHVDGSVHIPVGAGSFEAEVKILAKKNPGKKISFY